jgi:hypothetical protein
LAGCATANKQIAATENTIHTYIAALDDKERDFCSKNPSFKQQCDDLNPLIVTLLKAGDAVNRAAASQNAADLAALAKAGSAVADALQKLPATASGQMFEDLFKALGAATGGK